MLTTVVLAAGVVATAWVLAWAMAAADADGGGEATGPVSPPPVPAARRSALERDLEDIIACTDPAPQATS